MFHISYEMKIYSDAVTLRNEHRNLFLGCLAIRAHGDWRLKMTGE